MGKVTYPVRNCGLMNRPTHVVCTADNVYRRYEEECQESVVYILVDFLVTCDFQEKAL